MAGMHYVNGGQVSDDVTEIINEKEYSFENGV